MCPNGSLCSPEMSRLNFFSETCQSKRPLANLQAVGLNIAVEDVVFRLTYLVLRLEQVMGNVLLLCDKAILSKRVTDKNVVVTFRMQSHAVCSHPKTDSMSV